jgi:enoyl-CoA hydratase/carnithine racemase
VAYEAILYEKNEGIATLTLNRPQVMNALNTQLREELAAALDDARRDPEVRAVILTGAGERAFSAGMDLREFSQRQGEPQPLTETRRYRFDRPNPVYSFDKPIIAAVNGLAFGGGTEMALLCDIIVASENASFALAEVKRGIIPGNGGTQRLPRMIGKNRALEMIMTAIPVDAQEAHRIGLANHVVPADQLMAKAEEIARAIMANAPVAVRMAKEAVKRGLDATLEEGLRIEADMSSFLQTTEDAKEGPRAFVEKRAPQWKGR